MRRAKYFVLGLAGALTFAILLEGLLRFLPVDSGLRMLPVNEAHPFMLALSGQDYTYSHGWLLSNVHRGRTNNEGIPNSRDWRPVRRAALVMGDSFIESRMNDYVDTLQGRLERFLAPLPVFSTANAGANAADYLHMVAYAQEHFNLAALVLRIDSIDFLESLPAYSGIHAGHGWFGTDADGRPVLRSSAYQPSETKEFARHFALMRYFHRNLKYDPLAGIRREITETGKKLAEGNMAAQRTGSVDARPAVDYFLAELPLQSGIPLQHVVFVLDCNRKTIYQSILGDTGLSDQDNSGVMKYFAGRARAVGARVIDTCPAMESYVRRTWQRLDYSPADYHWNAEGHALVAESVMQELTEILR